MVGYIPSAGSKTSWKKSLGALAPFNLTLYCNRSGISSFFFHSSISSQWGIHCPSLNSSTSFLAIYNTSTTVIFDKAHYYLPTSYCIMNHTPRNVWIHTRGMLWIITGCNVTYTIGWDIGTIFHPSCKPWGISRVISLFWNPIFNEVSHSAKWS